MIKWYIVYHYFIIINYACIAYEIKFVIVFILLYKNTKDINEMCDSVNMNICANDGNHGNILQLSRMKKTSMFEDV